MTRWDRWGKTSLRDGDIVFRLGDARTLLGWFPLSHFISQATASPFSHTGIIAIEDGAAIVYDCSSSGIQRQPFPSGCSTASVPLGVKRLKAEHRGRIPGVLGFCRKVFEQQLPFDYEFRHGRHQVLLPRADREGLPVAGPGPVGAGADRRLGRPGQLPAHRLRLPPPLGTGAESAHHAGSARLPSGQ